MHNDQLDGKRAGPVTAAPQSSPPLSPAVRWLEDHGDALYAFALRRVRRPELAEDLVQETLLAALTARSTFSGRSAERTWLVGILRHKLIDHLRKAFVQHERGGEHECNAEPDGSAEYFDERGNWKIKVAAWHEDPGQKLQNAEFLAVLESCLSKLPPRVAQVFWLREAEAMESASVCRELRISPGNLWAMLHRARLGLRRCLSIHWFKNDEK